MLQWLGTSLFCFFPPFLLSSNFFQNLPILLRVSQAQKHMWLFCQDISQFSNCSIRVSRFLFCVTALLEYLDLFHAICAKFLFFRVHFTKIVPIMPAFCSLLLSSYFSKKFAGKIDVSLAMTNLQLLGAVPQTPYLRDLDLLHNLSPAPNFKCVAIPLYTLTNGSVIMQLTVAQIAT